MNSACFSDGQAVTPVAAVSSAIATNMNPCSTAFMAAHFFSRFFGHSGVLLRLGLVVTHASALSPEAGRNTKDFVVFQKRLIGLALCPILAFPLVVGFCNATCGHTSRPLPGCSSKACCHVARGLPLPITTVIVVVSSPGEHATKPVSDLCPVSPMLQSLEVVKILNRTISVRLA